MGTHPIFESDFDCLTAIFAFGFCYLRAILKGDFKQHKVSVNVGENSIDLLTFFNLRQKHPFDTKLLCYPRQNPTGYPGKSVSANDSVFDEQDHQNQVQSDEMKMEQILEE